MSSRRRGRQMRSSLPRGTTKAGPVVQPAPRKRAAGILAIVALGLAMLVPACGPPPAPTATASARPTMRLQGATGTPLQPTPVAPPSVLPTAWPPATATALPLAATATPPPVTVTPSVTAVPPIATHPPPAPSPAATATVPPPTPESTATLPPTPLPRSSAPSIRRETVTIMTYPYQDYLTTGRSLDSDMTYERLDWQVYQAAAHMPAPRTFAVLVLENEYLRVSVLPELGGRIYEMIFKPTGHNELYRNPVLKPTGWGPADQGWWLAAGGIEWCLPVAEHGYEWGTPWQFSTAQGGDRASVTVWDAQAGDRLRASVTITLESGRSYVTISPLIENPTSEAQHFQFWLNAMLAPGGGNRAGEALEFIVPATQVTVHSTGDRGLPLAGQALAWPVYNGRVLQPVRDLAQLPGLL